MIFSFANPLVTVGDYQEAIAEAWEQSESLFLQSDVLAEEASRWEDRARTLELELSEALIAGL